MHVIKSSPLIGFPFLLSIIKALGKLHQLRDKAWNTEVLNFSEKAQIKDACKTQLSQINARYLHTHTPLLALFVPASQMLWAAALPLLNFTCTEKSSRCKVSYAAWARSLANKFPGHLLHPTSAFFIQKGSVSLRNINTSFTASFVQ